MTSIFKAKVLIDAGDPKTEFQELRPPKSIVVEAYVSVGVLISIEEDGRSMSEGRAVMTTDMVEALIHALQSALTMARISPFHWE